MIDVTTSNGDKKHRSVQDSVASVSEDLSQRINPAEITHYQSLRLGGL